MSATPLLHWSELVRESPSSQRNRWVAGYLQALYIGPCLRPMQYLCALRSAETRQTFTSGHYATS